MKKILLFVALLFVLICFGSCAKVEEPQFRKINDFTLNKIGLQQADVGFSVVYYNPNNFGVNVKEAALDVYLDSTYIGKFTQPKEVSVDKKAVFTIPLIGSIPIEKALQLKVEDLVNKDVLVQAAGSVKVGKAGVFVSRDIKYQGKHRVDLNL